MVPFVSSPAVERAEPSCLNWLGRSGQLYPLMPVTLSELVLTDEDLFVLVRADKVLWVGSADDVVGDAASRARFRWALAGADRAYAVPAEAGSAERLMLQWDLEAAEPVTGLRVA